MKKISTSFENNVTNIHQEKVFIHTDRSIYVTGETIWMSIYIVDAAVLMPSNVSKVINVELIDSNGQPVLQERIQLKNNGGQGQLFISPQITSGSYSLRAYTNWMRNFDPGLSFYKNITVINPTTKFQSTDVIESTQNPIIEFYPEGGHLTNDIAAKVVVKSTDSFQKGLSLTGIVFDNNDIEVASFNTSDQGYAYFNLTPEYGKVYTAKVAIDSLLLDYVLPIVEKNSINLSVTPTEENRYEVSINASSDLQKIVYLVIHTQEIINQIKEIDLRLSKQFFFTTNQLSPGISHFTILDGMNPIAERTVFTSPMDSKIIDLELNKELYDKRDKVSLALKADALVSGDKLDKLSISISKSAPIDTKQDDIVSNLLLNSHTRGSQIKNSIDSSNGQTLDLFISAYNWRTVDWNKVLNNEKVAIKYPAELHAPILSGQIVNVGSSFPKSLQMGFFGRSSSMNSIDLNSQGEFNYEIPFRIRNKKVHFFNALDSLTKDQIVIHSPFEFPQSVNKVTAPTLSEELVKYLEELYTNIQVAQVYRKKHNHINGLPSDHINVDRHFYGKPDYVYMLDDFTRFETVKDLFIEYIRKAIIKKNRSGSTFHVMINEKLSKEPALLMIDGLPIYDTDYILSFDPLKVEKIEIIDDLYYIGSQVHTGIINFTTYEGDFASQELPSYLIEKDYFRLQQPRLFYSPDYSLHQSLLKRIPDYRNTLYWNPDIEVNSRGEVAIEFYTSDESGEFQIEINGVTKNGTLIYLKDKLIINGK